MIVYKAENKNNGKIYIGCTTNSLEYRKNQHVRDGRCKTRKNTAFTQAICDHGIESFVFNIVEEVKTLDEMFSKEEYYIKKYKSLIHENGYNLTTGGKSGKRFEQTSKKMKAHTKSVWENEESVKKMLAGLKRGSDTHVKNCKEKLVPMECKTCGKVIMLPKGEAEKRKYCSHDCVPFYLEGIELAAQVNIETRKQRHLKIKECCLSWTKNNIETIQSTKFNNIENELEDMIDFIYSECGVKDYRTIGMAVCGKQSRKELLKSLKEYVKMYAEPDWNQPIIKTGETSGTKG